MTEDETLMCLVHQFLRVNNKLTQVQKKPLTFSNGVRVTVSSIHLLEVIANNNAANLTQLSGLLGVTKGSVSQQIPKLEAEKLIERQQREDNKREVFFTVTDLGLETLGYHANLHEPLYDSIRGFLSKLSEENVHNASELLKEISTSIDEYLLELSD